MFYLVPCTSDLFTIDENSVKEENKTSAPSSKQKSTVQFFFKVSF